MDLIVYSKMISIVLINSLRIKYKLKKIGANLKTKVPPLF